METTSQHIHPLGVPPRLLAQLDRLVTPQGRQPRAVAAVISGPTGHDKHLIVETWLERHPELESHHVTPGDDHPEADEHSVLVVSDPGMLADRQVVGQLLQRAQQPGGPVVVMVGRSRPSVPLGRLVARGHLVDIDSNQLAWTPDEVRRAFEVALDKEVPFVHVNEMPDPEPGLHKEISANKLTEVMVATGGWPLAVRLMTSQPLTPAHAAWARRVLGEFLDEEILAGLDGADRALLEELAPLPRVDASSARWMSGRTDAIAQCARMQAAGVPLMWGERGTISLNPLLRGHLLHQLQVREPERFEQQVRRGVMWLRHAGRCLEAVTLASRAGMSELALKLTSDLVVREMHRDCLLEDLPALIELMPPGWPRGLLRSLELSLESSTLWLSQLNAVESQMLAENTPLGLATYASMTFGSARTMGYPSHFDLTNALSIAEQLDRERCDELELPAHASMTAEYGMWLMHQGRLVDAARVLNDALATSRLVDARWTTSLALSGLAMVMAVRGEARSALLLAGQAMNVAEEAELRSDEQLNYATLACAIAHADRGESELAKQALTRTEEVRGRSLSIVPLACYARVKVMLAEGDSTGALGEVETRLDQAGEILAWHEFLLMAVKLHALVRTRQAEQSRALLGRLAANRVIIESRALQLLEAAVALCDGDAETCRSLLLEVADRPVSELLTPKAVMSSWTLLAIACEELGRESEAHQAHHRAAALARTMGLDTPGAIHHHMLGLRLAPSSALTEAERKVLLGLDASLTLPETAQQLFISQNTLKTHLRRIYRKLGVQGRAEAIRRGELLGLRPTPEETDIAG